MNELDYKELSTVLASLRYFQQYIDQEGVEAAGQIFPHFVDIDPLNSQEIDELCARLNYTGHKEG